ncbi:MAG: hypothetical protein LQ351_007325 [Letrouitia transgressa]|nr:MAG: hypothetical protein LQ351_007325 [Letrouitia transgressa]
MQLDSSVDDASSLFSKDVIIEKLSETRRLHPNPFCLRRISLPAEKRPRGVKRSIDEVLDSWDRPNPKAESQKSNRVTKIVEPELSIKGVTGWHEPLILPSAPRSDELVVADIQAVANRVVQNSGFGTGRLSCTKNAETYRLPPLSSCVLCDINDASATYFSNAVRKSFPEPSSSAAPGQFDFVLLDPPWHNKSVRRSGIYKANTRRGSGPMRTLRHMLGDHFAPRAVVACWITNSSAVRRLAVETFDQWNVELTEEWRWLKTTVHGELVGEIDASWRRPYETLLLGRMRDPIQLSPYMANEKAHEVHKRLIVAVPDFHSRKPSLKELIEPMMPNRSDYRALEIFARNLTAGWWSWGDEALKYNWEGYWAEAR